MIPEVIGKPLIVKWSRGEMHVGTITRAGVAEHKGGQHYLWGMVDVSS